MEGFLKKAIAIITANRWVLLILTIGLVLLLMPSLESEPEETVAVTEKADLQQELAEILGAIEGVGQVKVMLTVEMGERIIYQNDESGTSSDTVIITDEDRAQQGLVQQILSPTYRGAIIVCQGGGSPAVQLKVVEAVSRITGLTTDKITVLKMK